MIRSSSRIPGPRPTKAMLLPSNTPPSGEQKDVVLHIGTGKTGTSSLQTLLHRNRKRLLDRGILYPKSPGKRRHIRLGLSMQPDEERPRSSPGWRRQQVSTPAQLRPLFEEQLRAEMAQAPAPLLLFSDEALYGSADGGLRNLREFTDTIARSVRVVVYVRRQDDHLCSRYQQVVKRETETRTLAERVDQMDLSATYDYHARLTAWRNILEPDEMVVRRFERASFSDGSLYRDFLEATGVGVMPEDLDEGKTRNESIDAESVEFLRILNLLRRDHEDEVAGVMKGVRAVRRLEGASSGPTLTLPESRLDRFMAQWEESNSAVARDFLDDSSGTLFTTPRKTRNTTDEQHLDPARVDHFVDLLEIPGSLHVPLRRLAEQEARR